MVDHLNSSKLNDEYLCKYSNIFQFNKKKFTGYKLVRKRNLNYYSIVTGMYRYKPGNVNSTTSYWKLYKNTQYHIDEMEDKIAVFKSLEDLDKFYPDHYLDDTVVILKVELTGNLIELDMHNSKYECNAIAGTTIINMKEL